ncbi:uncharacterized protein isoform X2 [Salmo salar]|uniref:Uncharacterized protein isoform X2 n=1 Tax=Salmo salar TaxID=8030 RepID=A0A1S3T468_SALSA|nr:uncharacterized protein LOC106613538 isoform X2 [Salmo salar]|eukprot:XP_014071383.1 PREDICTED: uncharacterized protein LOC106613538 isoform X2 [Salmo salar]
MFILYGKDGERRYKKAIARKKNQTGQEVHYLLQTNGGASVCTLGHQQPGAHFSAAAAQIGALRKTRSPTTTRPHRESSIISPTTSQAFLPASTIPFTPTASTERRTETA